jgi:hypothetical protein
MKQQEALTLDTYMHIRVPSAFVALVDRCAAEQMMTTSAFTRAALVAALTRHGVATPRLASNMKRRDVLGESEKQAI